MRSTSRRFVQIPFELPGISIQEVEKLLFSRLDELIKGVPEKKWDQAYWGNIYHSGLRYFLGLDSRDRYQVH